MDIKLEQFRLARKKCAGPVFILFSLLILPYCTSRHSALEESVSTEVVAAEEYVEEALSEVQHFFKGDNLKNIITEKCACFVSYPSENTFEEPNFYYKSILKEILKFSGLPALDIGLCSGREANQHVHNVKLNCKQTCDCFGGCEDCLILFKEVYLDDIRKLSNSSWPTVSVFAHELGHFVLRHNTNVSSLTKPERHRQEKEADYFAGHLLGKMGASEKETLLVLEKHGDEYDTETHPNKRVRIREMKRGYLDASAYKPPDGFTLHDTLEILYFYKEILARRGKPKSLSSDVIPFLLENRSPQDPSIFFSLQDYYSKLSNKETADSSIYPGIVGLNDSIILNTDLPLSDNLLGLIDSKSTTPPLVSYDAKLLLEAQNQILLLKDSLILEASGLKNEGKAIGLIRVTRFSAYPIEIELKGQEEKMFVDNQSLIWSLDSLGYRQLNGIILNKKNQKK